MYLIPLIITSFRKGCKRGSIKKYIIDAKEKILRERVRKRFPGTEKCLFYGIFLN